MGQLTRSLARIGLVSATAATICGITAGTAAADPPAVATLVMNGEMHYDAAAGQNNQIIISNPSVGVVQFMDVVPIVYSTPDGSTCSYPYPPSTSIVHCVHGATFLDIKTYDGNDLIDNRTKSNMHAAGGDGHDEIRMGGKVTPAAAGDATGGSGNDLIVSGPGDDYLDGGSGVDTLSYRGRTTGVTASLVTGNGGTTGGDEVDVFSNFENLTGAGGNDVFTGNTGPNVLDGGSYTTPCLTHPSPPGLASTTLASAPPPCTSYSGVDVLIAGDGTDTLIGRGDDDRLYGGNGNDSLSGGGGVDQLHGMAGIDTCDSGPDGGAIFTCEL
jgi:hypothetical protein